MHHGRVAVPPQFLKGIKIAMKWSTKSGQNRGSLTINKTNYKISLAHPPSSHNTIVETP